MILINIKNIVDYIFYFQDLGQAFIKISGIVLFFILFFLLHYKSKKAKYTNYNKYIYHQERK